MIDPTDRQQRPPTAAEEVAERRRHKEWKMNLERREPDVYAAVLSGRQITEVMTDALNNEGGWYSKVEAKFWPEGCKKVEEVLSADGAVYVHVEGRQLRLTRAAIERGAVTRARSAGKSLLEWFAEMDGFEADCALQLALFREVRY